MKRYILGWLLTAALLAVVGCQGQRASSPTPAAESPASDDTSDAAPAAPRDKRMGIAVQAKDELIMALSGRLTAVMQAEGPVAAIQVCSQEALTISAAVGEQHGVAIGRTSFKLRNPANAPRDWVKPLVEQRSTTPQQVELESGSLGALFPIFLTVNCLICHGGPEEILEAVKPELASRYPDDGATGFQQGDLRGWVWVEVPASGLSTTAAASQGD